MDLFTSVDDAQRVFEARFSNQRKSPPRVLVIGDPITDQCCLAAHPKPSAERDGVWQYTVLETRYCPGGAANVACGFAALGCRTDFLVPVGAKAELEVVWGVAKRPPVNIIEHRALGQVSRCTRKLRVRSQNGSLITRVDHDHYAKDHDPHAVFPDEVRKADAVVFVDYNKGAITASLLARTDQLDGGLHVITTKPRKAETLKALALPHWLIVNGVEWEQIAPRVPSHVCSVAITRGADEVLYAIEKDFASLRLAYPDWKQHRPTVRAVAPIVDPCGCGDSFLVGFTAAMIRGPALAWDKLVACGCLVAYTAGITPGTQAPSLDDVMKLQ